MAVKFWWGRSRLQQLAQLVKARGVCFAFAPRPTKNLPPEVSEQIGPHTHLQSALSARHPLFAHALIDPSAEFAVELQETLGSDLSRWRRVVLDEIKELKEECQEETSSWFRQLPPHGRISYQDRVFPNVPLLRRLDEVIGFPGLDQLLRDLSSHFSLLGRLEPGSCWENKGVWKPEQILCKEEFFTRNLEYIQHPCTIHVGYSCPRSEIGCFPPSFPLLALPVGHTAAAVAFSIVTEGPNGTSGPLKVRRGEDWRRSFHNSTTQTCDGSRHHTVDDLVPASRWMFARGHRHLQFWSQDHESAIGSFSTTDPNWHSCCCSQQRDQHCG